ncbi:MAG: isoleucyl-tRNA synthetase [Actinomycetota bacterium]|jgi:isoleucyl-tRNA synthetase|nr:isoleucyl-tRNA synthetase [Actinomycetota bacterium]
MADSLYSPVTSQVNFPELEVAMARTWKDERVFERSLEQREGRPEWVFYEGPPTANNKPGIHHVEARVFKDIFCRYQTMRGHYVSRKAGWDCHGLPVEVEVEKELGITNKRQIEDEVGIEVFVEKCRESVQRYVGEWEPFTDRIGFWVDLDQAYWTMTPSYIETVWWLLRQIWDKGLLEEDFKVVPYCPRCETSLSNHEQHQTDAYQTVSDPSAYVRFPLAADPDTSLLVWTTTPWTLLANMAAAVHENIVYSKVVDPKLPGKHLIVARERIEHLFGEDAVIVEDIPGTELIGRKYTPPFDFVGDTDVAHTVRPGDFVTTEDGTGIVHLAPYGEDDMAVGKRDELPITQMIASDGHVVPEGGEFAGLWIKDADPKIIENLEARDLLWKAEVYSHSYPHCWRCKTPLLYYPRKDWYIRTSQIRDQLQKSNEETNWQPPTIKYGRFGDWLANNVDWSLSRDRYWGTPLPIWRCSQEHATCVGSFTELSDLAGRDITGIDPHRPYIDDITITCPECGETAQRVPSVIDTWFDAGSMPFGQWHYPFENEDVFEARYPADFISEAIDQTRGWFYTLLAISTLVRGHNSFKNVVCLGHIVDADGRKMSKSVGNVIDPWSILDVQGADALRWYMLTGGTPWSSRRLSAEIVQESLRKYLLTLWNTYSFWVTYAALEGFDPATDDVPLADRSDMDRWILAELDTCIRETTTGLDEFDPTRGGRRLDRFVDDLSNWYVRRSRRRFWKSGQDTDTKAAFRTLWECLVTVAQLSAPYTPHVSDVLYRNLTGPLSDAPSSVHLSDWPEPDAARADDTLRRSMELVRQLVTLGRSARTDAKVRVRQPLARAVIVMPSAHARDLEGLEDLVSEELNVKHIEVVSGLADLVSYSVKPNFKALGPRFGARVKDVAAALGAADARSVVESIEGTGEAQITLGGKSETLTRDELDVRVEGREGFSLVQDGPYGVALDLEITDELRAEGIAREVVRAIQDLRKAKGLAVEDRITLRLGADDPVITGALEAHRDFVAREVLATEFELTGSVPDADEVALDEGVVHVSLEKS